MEEVREIVHLINSLPTLAIWVLVGFWCYKVIVIGSLYGLIRFAIAKALEAYKKERVVKTVMETKLGGLIIGGEDGGVMHALTSQIMRVASSGGYIHAEGVNDLRKALDMLEESRKAKTAPPAAKL